MPKINVSDPHRLNVDKAVENSVDQLIELERALSREANPGRQSDLYSQMSKILVELQSEVSDSILPFGTIERVMGGNFVGPQDYIEFFGGKQANGAAPIPECITAALLNSDCPLSALRQERSAIRDTHILAYIPERILSQALNLRNFRCAVIEFCKENALSPCLHAGAYLHWSDSAARSRPDHWVLIPKETLPGTLNRWREQQFDHLHKEFPDYDVASTRDIVIAIGMHYLKTGERGFGNWGATRDEVHAGIWQTVGGFDKCGVRIGASSLEARKDLGLAVVRRIDNSSECSPSKG